MTDPALFSNGSSLQEADFAKSIQVEIFIRSLG